MVKQHPGAGEPHHGADSPLHVRLIAMGGAAGAEGLQVPVGTECQPLGHVVLQLSALGAVSLGVVKAAVQVYHQEANFLFLFSLHGSVQYMPSCGFWQDGLGWIFPRHSLLLRLFFEYTIGSRPVAGEVCHDQY